MNTDNTNCPRCGAEPHSRNIAGEFAQWKCGYWNYPDVRPELCLEREAHNKTRLELAELKARWPENMAIEYLRDCLKGAEAENQKLRKLLENVIDVLRVPITRARAKTLLSDIRKIRHEEKLPPALKIRTGEPAWLSDPEGV